VTYKSSLGKSLHGELRKNEEELGEMATEVLKAKERGRHSSLTNEARRKRSELPTRNTLARKRSTSPEIWMVGRKSPVIS